MRRVSTAWPKNQLRLIKEDRHRRYRLVRKISEDSAIFVDIWPRTDLIYLAKRNGPRYCDVYRLAQEETPC